MSARRLVTALTLIAAAGVLVVMAVWGYDAATAPIADDTTGSTSGPTCPPENQKVTRYVHRGEITVSVYNAGTRSGSAQAALALLEQAGFKAGEVGNAPDGIEVKKAVVYTTKSDDPAAQLVARTLGEGTEVAISDDELGPGVDLVIGNKFKQQLDPAAPNKIALPEPVTSCE